MEQALVFRLGEMLFGLPVHHLREVVEETQLHFIPRTAADFLGAINFHGAVLPVLDAGAFLGQPDDKRDHRFIVLASRTCPLALAVSAVHRFVSLEAETSRPYEGEGPAARFIHSVHRVEERDIHLLDAVRLLASFEKT